MSSALRLTWHPRSPSLIRGRTWRDCVFAARSAAQYGSARRVSGEVAGFGLMRRSMLSAGGLLGGHSHDWGFFLIAAVHRRAPVRLRPLKIRQLCGQVGRDRCV
jgi:hypothetical protein